MMMMISRVQRREYGETLNNPFLGSVIAERLRSPAIDLNTVVWFMSRSHIFRSLKKKKEEYLLLPIGNHGKLACFSAVSEFPPWQRQNCLRKCCMHWSAWSWKTVTANKRTNKIINKKKNELIWKNVISFPLLKLSSTMLYGWSLRNTKHFRHMH